ncbi:MAG: response regulator transcription factor [Caldilineaceae bacterium]|nr:response regulator transcription factor [Caldilineaceae bacterium]
MRVLLADDEPLLRSAVRFLLEQESGIQIVAEVTDVAELLIGVAETRPDIVLLDWELPGLNNTGSVRNVLNSLYTSCPSVTIIVLSGRPEAGRHALASGASTFVSKADPPERLLAALRRNRSESEF